MQSRRRRLGPGKPGPSIIDLTGSRASGQNAYREKALALFPHVCAKCRREFSGKDLRELTVHHIDNNHMNNPPDGSNWELLCLYCHDDAHGAYERLGYQQGATVYSDEDASAHNPFAALGSLLKQKEDKPHGE